MGCMLVRFVSRLRWPGGRRTNHNCHRRDEAIWFQSISGTSYATRNGVSMQRHDGCGSLTWKSFSLGRPSLTSGSEPDLLESSGANVASTWRRQPHTGKRRPTAALGCVGHIDTSTRCYLKRYRPPTTDRYRWSPIPKYLGDLLPLQKPMPVAEPNAGRPQGTLQNRFLLLYRPNIQATSQNTLR